MTLPTCAEGNWSGKSLSDSLFAFERAIVESLKPTGCLPGSFIAMCVSSLGSNGFRLVGKCPIEHKEAMGFHCGLLMDLRALIWICGDATTKP